MTTNLPKKRILSVKKFSWRNIFLFSILVLGLLFWKFKGFFIVATVNGQPISKWQLHRELVKKFGNQVLENIINERLILSATRQQGIFVTEGEIKERIKSIEHRLVNTSLDEALKLQGLTREDFKRQVEIQIAIEKLFDKEATVSTQEINDYLTKNREKYKSATNPAMLRLEVEGILRQQKITDLFEKWFTEVRKNAKVKKYL